MSAGIETSWLRLLSLRVATRASSVRNENIRLWVPDLSSPDLPCRDLPSPAAQRYLALDIWRGIACLSVIIYHATYYSPEEADALGFDSLAAVLIGVCGKLWLGVAMFFVISGYCIAATADSSQRRSEPLRTYFFRRFRRIYPSFWALLGICVVVVASCEGLIAPGLFADDNHRIAAPWHLSAWQWLGNLTLTETWRGNVIGDHKSLFMGHAWTLCYEEQFYGVCGLILFIAPRNFFRGIVVVTIAVLPGALLAHRFKWPGFFFDGYWLAFASGVFVYHHVNYATPRMRRLIECGFALSVAACCAASFLRLPFGAVPQHCSVAFVFALVLILTNRWDRQIAGSPWLQPIRNFGLMSYSVYLVHWPITKAISHTMSLAGLRSNTITILVTVPVCLAVSLLAALPFYLLIERRFLNSNRKFTVVSAPIENSRAAATPRPLRRAA